MLSCYLYYLLYYNGMHGVFFLRVLQSGTQSFFLFFPSVISDSSPPHAPLLNGHCSTNNTELSSAPSVTQPPQCHVAPGWSCPHYPMEGLGFIGRVLRALHYTYQRAIMYAGATLNWVPVMRRFMAVYHSNGSFATIAPTQQLHVEFHWRPESWRCLFYHIHTQLYFFLSK